MRERCQLVNKIGKKKIGEQRAMHLVFETGVWKVEMGEQRGHIFQQSPIQCHITIRFMVPIMGEKPLGG